MWIVKARAKYHTVHSSVKQVLVAIGKMCVKTHRYCGNIGLRNTTIDKMPMEIKEHG